MRTTLTLEDDVAAELKKLSTERRESFKRTVNQVMRAGIAAVRGKKPSGRSRYRLKPVSLGGARIPNLENIEEVIAVIEGEDHD